MSINLVNLGNYPNDGSGDDLRTAFIKTNSNTSYLDDVKVEFAENLGLGAPIFVDKQNKNLRFRSILSPLFSGGTPDIKEKMSISYDSEDITLSVIAIADIVEDTTPELGGHLNLNNFNINGTGNISILGDIAANTITANNRFFGNLTGDVLSSGLSIFDLIQVNNGNINNTNITNSNISNVIIDNSLIDNTIIGSTSPNTIIGTTITANNGFFGNLFGNVFGIDTTITIEALNTSTNEFNDVFINGLIFTGNHSINPGTNVISTVVNDGLVIFGDTELRLSSNNTIVLESDVEVLGNIITDIVYTSGVSNVSISTPLTIYSANTINLTSLFDINLEVYPPFNGDGGVISLLAAGGGLSSSPGFNVGGKGGSVYIGGGAGGNDDIFGDGGDIFLTGGAGTVPGNVIIKGGEKIGPIGRGNVIVDNIKFSKNNVITNPSTGQVLIWTGDFWEPGTITSGVSKIIAGSNITVSPSNGLGEVTINATTGGITGLNTFDFGNFKNVFTNPIAYLLNQVGLNFGTFASPNQITVDLGSF
jgi:hypothetical protein